jgi:hypothetical protein
MHIKTAENQSGLTDKGGKKVTPLRVLYEQALKDFPHPKLTATGGYTTSEGDIGLVYSEEFLFSPQQLAKELFGKVPKGRLEGWTLIDLRMEDGTVIIQALLDVTKNGDFEHGRLLAEKYNIYGNYSLESGQWTFWISR